MDNNFTPLDELERLAEFYAKYGYKERAREIRVRLRTMRQRYAEFNRFTTADNRHDADEASA